MILQTQGSWCDDIYICIYVYGCRLQQSIHAICGALHYCMIGWYVTLSEWWIYHYLRGIQYSKSSDSDHFSLVFNRWMRIMLCCTQESCIPSSFMCKWWRLFDLAATALLLIRLIPIDYCIKSDPSVFIGVGCDERGRTAGRWTTPIRNN